MPSNAQHALEHPEVAGWALELLTQTISLPSKNTFSLANSARR